jgi:hypothetical protein
MSSAKMENAMSDSAMLAVARRSMTWVIRIFSSLDLGATRGESCFIGERCRYDGDLGERLGCGGEVRQNEAGGMACEGEETTKELPSCLPPTPPV